MSSFWIKVWSRGGQILFVCLLCMADDGRYEAVATKVVFLRLREPAHAVEFLQVVNKSGFCLINAEPFYQILHRIAIHRRRQRRHLYQQRH